ncbi:metallophosphoesterase [Mucilaginibacter xinganensis]|uniref:Calcineurin-like phosphoesterase n=1 Tax=Mucilaginibacter xinganensis TaxID=1234841 RepID=A0A223NTT9_9SPHI|nr:metallophosphoesterase [Mucilaginibacter xinganensis]ASU33094.1 Calcineurin-like phosphoesterase [Mucilaginibacter xinganensis]
MKRKQRNSGAHPANGCFTAIIILLALILNLSLPGNTYAQGRCLIVSDIHLNPFFTTDGNYGINNELVQKLSAAKADEWGEILDNYAAKTIDSNLRGHDSNYPLLISALDNMYLAVKRPDFIIIAGDFIWHNNPADTALKQKSIQFIAGLFHKKFPGVPIIPTLGNNDSNNDYEKQSPQFLQNFASAWQLEKQNADTALFKSRGYYTATIGKLRFVVLNTSLVSKNSVAMGYNYYNDGYAMVNDWLKKELTDTINKVWIISHIPPGTNGFDGKPMWMTGGPKGDLSAMFTGTVVNNSRQVEFMIASHTHFNDFRVFYPGTSTIADSAAAYMRIVPSIGMDHRNNPSFEIADFDGAYHVTKETNYYLDLSKLTGKEEPTKLKWSDMVSLNNFTAKRKIDAKTLSNLVDKMLSQSKIRTYYDQFYGAGHPTGAFTNPVKYPAYLKAEKQNRASQ